MSFGELKLDTFNYGSMSPMGGSNPFGNAAAGFVGDIFSGKNFYDAAGERINQMGQQVAAQAMNSIFSAVGGAITGAISVGAEKAKNTQAKAKTESANAATKAAADNGNQKAKELIQETDGKIAGYNTQIQTLTSQLEEAQKIAEEQKKEITNKLTEIQKQISDYEIKTIEREGIERQINSEKDESKKAKLQEQLKAKDGEIEGLTTGINNIQAELDTIRTTIEDSKKVAAENAKQATKVQENAQTISENASNELTTIGTETTTQVNNNATRAAQSASTENSNGAAQIKMAKDMEEQAAAKSITGVGTVFAGSDLTTASTLRTIGNGAKGSAQAGNSTLTAAMASFSGQIQGLGTLVQSTNTNFNNLGTNIETFNTNVETFNTFADELIANTTIYDVKENSEKKDEKKETKAA